ncbi:MAG: FAD-dependent monooxygenase [Hyphomonadaceae bacterium]|nr:FAD-dependent monooxygenase [Hyphomonadaceae bacterium]
MFDLVIIGAGPTGGTLALACASLGLRVALVDARDPKASPPRDTRNFAIVRGSWNLLVFSGLEEALRPHAEPLNGLEAIDGARHWLGAPSACFTGFDLPETAEDATLGVMLEAEHLQAAIDAALAASDQIQHHAPARFDSYEHAPGHVIVHLEDETELPTRLLVGCDGLHSPVRQAAGIPTEGRNYGKSVFAADVQLSRPHDGIARQLFTPEGPFATLPLSGNRANLAWYMKTGAAEALAERPVEEITAELNARFAAFAGDMRIDGPVRAYPLILQVAASMISERVALVGDAARRINPLAGQGLNLGFKDVAALAEVCADQIRAGLDPGDVLALERYQSWRRPDGLATALGMDLIDRVFSNDNAILKPLRGLALAVANRATPLRSALARQASAAQDHLPSLMQDPGS